MTDPERVAGIAERLTEAQRKALLKAEPNVGNSSYSMQTGLNTADALYRRSLFTRHNGPGAMWSPQTAVRYTITPLGLAVRAHLLTQESSRDD